MHRQPDRSTLVVRPDGALAPYLLFLKARSQDDALIAAEIEEAEIELARRQTMSPE